MTQPPDPTPTTDPTSVHVIPSLPPMPRSVIEMAEAISQAVGLPGRLSLLGLAAGAWLEGVEMANASRRREAALVGGIRRLREAVNADPMATPLMVIEIAIKLLHDQAEELSRRG